MATKKKQQEDRGFGVIETGYMDADGSWVPLILEVDEDGNLESCVDADGKAVVLPSTLNHLVN